jgi:outer membrane protein OmpA-like peptidoglycan-associated protein
MRSSLVIASLLAAFACGGSQSGGSSPAASSGEGAARDGEGSGGDGATGESSDAGEFAIKDTDKSGRPTQAKLKATDTEAAVRFFVVDKDKGPIPGIVISLTAPGGKTFYAPATDKDGFTEVLLPIGTTYELVYLSLGRKNVAAKVAVKNEPRLNLKLTMRYQREEIAAGDVPRFVLDDVQFASGKATLTQDSAGRLDSIVEYLTHKPSARIEISGHTDDTGKKQVNKKLSQQRADAVRAYLVSAGVASDRVDAVGYGDEKPLVPNDSDENRQKNRRIEAREL